MPKSKPLPKDYKKSENYIQCQELIETSVYITTPLKYPKGTTLDDLTVKGYILKNNNSRLVKYKNRNEIYLICKCNKCKRLRIISPSDFGRRKETQHSICDSIFSDTKDNISRYHYYLHTLSPQGKPQLWKGVSSFCKATGFSESVVYRVINEAKDPTKYVSFKDWLLRKVYI